MDAPLKALFEPTAVALIGASSKEYSIGNVIIKNLIRYQYKGPIYPINPKEDSIRGIPAYKTIMDVPGPVDLAHIVIPPPFVPQEVENCGIKGVKAIIINTAGFKEMGAEGLALEEDFLARAKKYGIRIFGPNCQGIINSDPEFNAYCNFTFTYFKPGSISIVAQSGGVGAIIMQVLHDMDIGMRLYASNGNASDVSISDILTYYGEDPQTKVIILYLESLSDTATFMRTAQKVAAHKPILAISAGRTEKGAAASKSHTGGLAGGISMELILEKSGILSFHNLEDLCQAALAFSTQPLPKGNQVGLITNTGGPAIIATDELVQGGLQLPALSEQAVITLKQSMLEAASINNPLDVVATAGASHFKSAIETLMNEDQIHALYLTFVTPPFVDCVKVAEEIAALNLQQRKPMVCNFITDKPNWTETASILKAGGVPCFDYPESAAKALSALYRYVRIKNRIEGSMAHFTDIDKPKAHSILQQAMQEQRSILSAQEVYSLLQAYHIPVARWAYAESVEVALIAADQMGYPIVIKADSESIIHKSDVGAVLLNIVNHNQAEQAMNDLTAKFPQYPLHFLIQECRSASHELIVGVKKEEGLGHLIMFGLGGITVEIYKDVVFKIAPITDRDAKSMMDEIKAAALLQDFRGRKGIPKAQLEELLLRVSALVCDFPMIQELDLNPVFADENTICAVDARIIIS